MSDMKNRSEGSSARYFLEERELWESLEFDWKDWNATVQKILQQRSPTTPRTRNRPRNTVKPDQV